MDRREKRYQKQKLRRKVLLLLAAVIALAVIFGLFWSGVIFQGLLKPGKAENLSAKVRYADVTLSWDKAKNADGYIIYEKKGDEDPVMVGKAIGGKDCSYAVEDYTKDEPHEYFITAYKYNRFRDRDFEGEPSDTVTAEYDSSKYAQKIPILAYHQVLPAGRKASTGLAIPADRFDEQMRFLHDNGFTTLTLDEFRQWHAGKLEVPPKSCVVTFDDGFYGTYYLAYPIIKKYDQAAVVFCIGKNTAGVTDPYTEDPADKKNHYVREDVINKVRKEYPKFAFESHTYDMHNRVDGKKPAVSFSYDQIMEDCKKNEPFGFTYLAYPWGTYSDTMQQAVKDSGYKMAFAYRPFYYATRDDDTYAVNRIKINGDIPIEEFIEVVNGNAEKYNNPDRK
ncbi:MAG: polysaccharide deacetylase family protein [Firmicutes bacterium]|nr:polysaccharide deacetylase family protein [Bacillota bacterium]